MLIVHVCMQLNRVCICLDGAPDGDCALDWVLDQVVPLLHPQGDFTSAQLHLIYVEVQHSRNIWPLGSHTADYRPAGTEDHEAMLNRRAQQVRVKIHSAFAHVFLYLLLFLMSDSCHVLACLLIMHDRQFS